MKTFSLLNVEIAKKRQLTSTVSKTVRSEIVLLHDNNTDTFLVPKEVLDLYTPNIEKLEDKELFLLQHSNVEVSVFKKIIKKIKEIC